ncbi:MAG: response regulator [Treponema sp.]|nr:response regulator [Treponema sp.]
MAAGNRKKVFLVDDEEISLAIARNVLETNYEIITARSGKEALEKITQGGITPDLILLDIIMPNMDGWETFNRLKAISFLKEIPIAFLTIVNENNERKHAEEIGASDYITKPYETEELTRRVGAIIEKQEKKKTRQAL